LKDIEVDMFHITPWAIARPARVMNRRTSPP